MATVTTLVAAPVTGISEANGINTDGVVVGQEDTAVPFVWVPVSANATTGTATPLPVLPTGAAPGSGTAFAVNDAGVVVGFCETLDAHGTLVTRAVRWVSGAVQELGTLVPDPAVPGAFLGNSYAVDVNAAGQIVGRSDTASGVEHAFLFDPVQGVMRDLSSLVPPSMLPGVPDPSRATSINDHGDVVGVATGPDASGALVDRAFLLPAGATSLIDLGTLQPDGAGGFLGASSAFGIDGAGTVIGTSDDGLGPAGNPLTGATRFAAGAAPVPLLPVHSDGYDIGPAGHVVGSFDLPPRGFVLDPVTGLVDLGSLTGLAVDSGNGVNAAGQVIATATVNGVTTGILITP